MSVLPSFKSTFPSFADAEAVRVADDSALVLCQQPSTATNSASFRQPAFQDHFPSRLPNSWSPIQTAKSSSTNPVPDAPQSNLTSTTTATTSTAFQSIRPRQPFAPLPLDQLTTDSSPIAFGFETRSKEGSRPVTYTSSQVPRTLDRLPLEQLASGPDEFSFRTASVKRAHSSSVHAGAYKRPRSHSIVAGDAYVKSQTTSDSRSNLRSTIRTHRDHSESTVKRNTGHRGLSKSPGQVCPSFASSRRDSVKVAGLLSDPAEDHHRTTKLCVRPSVDGVTLPRPTSGAQGLSELQSQQRTGVVSVGGNVGMIASARGNGSVNTSYSDPRQIGLRHMMQNHSASPGVSCLAPSIAPNSSSLALPALSKGPNLLFDATPSISHRSGCSKMVSNGYNTRLTAEDNIIEESTVPAGVDVLSSPPERSLNSTLTGRTGLMRGALGPSLTMSRGPTASDLSVLMRRTQQGHREGDQKCGAPEDSPGRIVERRRPSHTITEATIGSDGEQSREKNESSRNGRHAPSIAKTRLNGRIVKREHEVLRCKNETGNQSMRAELLGTDGKGRMGDGQGARDRLWGGRGVSSDRKTWQASGEREGGEDWRHGQGGEVGKTEERLVGKTVKNKEKLWGCGVLRQEESKIRGSGAGMYCKAQVWKDGGKNELGSMVREGCGLATQQSVGDEWRRVAGVSGERKGIEEGENVQCPHCDRRLRNAVTLQNHVRVVHDHSGSFQCSQCSATFMWRSTLGNHVRLVHEKQRPYDCKECNKAFRWSSHLREHIWVVHKNEKPFRCDTCGKTFGRKNNMQKHMRKHLQQAEQQ